MVITGIEGHAVSTGVDRAEGGAAIPLHRLVCLSAPSLSDAAMLLPLRTIRILEPYFSSSP